MYNNIKFLIQLGETIHDDKDTGLTLANKQEQ